MFIISSSDRTSIEGLLFPSNISQSQDLAVTECQNVQWNSLAAKESANSQINETVLCMLLNCMSTAVPCAEGIPEIFLLCGSKIYIEVSCDNTVTTEDPD